MTTFLNIESNSPQPLPPTIKPSFTSHPTPFGQQLRQARQKLNLTIEEIAERMKLDPKQLKALEEERFKDLPGGTFIRGFTRQYARILKMDENALLEQLPSLTTHLNSTANHLGVLPRTKGLGVRRYHRAVLILGASASLIALFIGGFILLKRPSSSASSHNTKIPTFKTSSSELASPISTLPIQTTITTVESPLTNSPKTSANDATTPLAPSSSTHTVTTPTHSQENSISLTPKANTHHITVKATPHLPPRLELSFEEPSWVEIKDSTGHTLLSQMNTPGTRQSVMGEPPYTVTVSNPRAVTVSFKGIAVDIAPYAERDTAHFVLE